MQSRRWAAIALLVSVGTFAVLAVLVHDRADNRLDRFVYVHVLDIVPNAVIDALINLTDPPLVIGAIVSAALLGVLWRRWDVTVLVVAVPVLSVLLTERVLKPLIHRTDQGFLAFPSGHETGVASVACTFLIITLAADITVRAKIVLTAVLCADIVLAAVALVGKDYHYATDTVGALALSLAVTVTVALALDAVRARRERTEPTAVTASIQSP